MYKKSILLVGGVLLLTTGCGNSKLTCTSEVQGVETEAVISFKDKKADSVKMAMSMDMPDGTKIDDISEPFKDTFEQMGYKNVEVKEKNDKVNISLEADIDTFMKAQNMSEKDKDELTYDKLKESFESQNWTCK